MKYARGYVPDRAGYVRTEFTHLLAALGVEAKLRASRGSVIAACPPVFDQGQTGSCTGHATACASKVGFEAAGARIEWTPSPADIYRLGRGIDREWDPVSGFASSPLKDEGAQPNMVMRAVSTYGIRPIGPLAAGRYSDADPATINDEAKLGALEADAAMVIAGQYGITSSGLARYTAIIAALDAGRAVTVAIAADKDAIQGYDGRILSAADLGTNLDHYITIVGYVIVAGVPYFLLRNSWGSGTWGVSSFSVLPGDLPTDGSFPAEGNVIVDGSAISTMADLVVFDIHRKAA